MRVPAPVLVLSLLVAAPAPGRAAVPFLMPGLTEISAEPIDQGPARPPSEVGISYGLYLVGPFRGTAQVEVRRGKEVVAREKRARTLSLEERQTVRLGSGAIADNRFGAPLPDLVFPGAPGDYTLAVVLSGRKALLHPFQRLQLER